MNIALWIVQILLALAFLAAGFMKVSQPLSALEPRMGWVPSVGTAGVRAIGAVEILGAIGLILPAVFHIWTWLVPLAAIGFVLTMISAIVLHVRRNEYPNIAPVIVLLLLAAFVAWGRFAVVPIG